MVPMPSSSSSYKDKPSPDLLVFSGRWVSYSHTAVAYTAFLSALVVGMSLHFHKIVRNEFYGYPDEWFPSVSATIGDRYPERSFFQFFIAITSGPRFALVGLWYLLTAQPGRSLPKWIAAIGLFRTLTCGGWTYITSTDDHDWHDIFMILYLIATLPWTIGCIILSPNNARAVKYRKYLAGAFFGTLVPLVYFFIQHKVNRVPGAYTTYAFFEWSLILFDVAFDSVTALDFDTFELVVRDVKGASKGTIFTPAPSAGARANGEARDSNVAVSAYAGPLSLSSMVNVAAEVYHGFVFWSMLTSLGIVIWYFPLWHMGISGYEAFVMSTISPFLLSIKSVRSWVVNNLRAVHLLSLSGLAAYLIEMPEARLFTVGFGVAAACLGWAATLSTESGHAGRLETKVLAWTVGLIMSSLAKFAWWTNNPIWPVMNHENGGWNKTGIALAVLAALQFTSQPPLTPKSETAQTKPRGSTLLAALSVGALFFGLHSLLSDSSTMILWTWEGYPVRGPTSTEHGWMTIIAMSVGLVLGVFQQQLLTSWVAYAVGCAGAAALTLKGGWTGYYGAVAIAVYLMGVSVPIISNAAKHSVTTTFGLGFLVYNFLVLFHVWVVAYAFVPGGPLVREHTDWIMATMMALIGLGVWDLNSLGANSKPAAQGPAPHRRYFNISIAGLNVLFLLATSMRLPKSDPVPYHGDHKLITAGIWTIHFSLDNDMWSSERRMAQLFKEMEVDVVGLLESDLQRIIMGNRDTTQYLAEELGMYVDYGPGPNKHTWGAALLSKFPILNSTHHLLPSPVGELAPAIHATLDCYGEMVDVFVFHSGQEEDEEDRRLQSRYLATLMRETPRPAFLLSYLVTKPLEGNYHTYVGERSGMWDVDPTDWDRWCEYILYKGLRRTGYARVSRGTITDTEFQVAKFQVGGGVGDAPVGSGKVSREKSEEQRQRERDEVWALDWGERGRRKTTDDMPEGMRFPDMFKGDGVRGHMYHVFDVPRYFG